MVRFQRARFSGGTSISATGARLLSEKRSIVGEMMGVRSLASDDSE